jgi:microtubule-associated protein-like 1/2
VFPPDGFDQTHLARGGVLPDATLELDHVHGCGPGLVDQTAPVPIFCIPPRADPQTGKVNKENEECVYYAAGVCVARTLRDPRAVLAERAAENAARDALAARRKRQYMAGAEPRPGAAEELGAREVPAAFPRSRRRRSVFDDTRGQ